MTEPAIDPKTDPERHWLANVYRRDMAQLTLRSALAGVVIGGVMCLSNIYVFFKTGWSLGVTVTAVILAFAAFTLVEKLGLARRHFTLLENNAMGSVASAAGYMTGGGNMAAIPALILMTGDRPSTGWMILWVGAIALLGVFAAIPMKRQLINIEALPFPTGIATAETLESLHAKEATAAGHEMAPPTKDAPKDDVSGMEKARILARTGIIGAVVAVARDAKAAWIPFNLPKSIALPFGWGGHKAAEWSLSFDFSLILMGAGGIMGLRTCASILFGSIVCYGFVAPWFDAQGLIERGPNGEFGYKYIVKTMLWPAAAMLLSSGLLSFGFQYKSVLRSFAGLGSVFFKKKTGAVDPMADIECPPWWFMAGYVLIGPCIVWLAWRMFGIPIWAGIMALPLSFCMGIVASRVTGETDVTPTKALGPATQFIYAATLPGHLKANIMGANITGGVGLHAADLLTDLKAGFLVGANPRQQFYAQMLGCVAGAFVVIPAFNLVIPDASLIGSKEFPAPSVLVWAGVSQALTNGIGAVPAMVKNAAIVGAIVGAILATFERFAPKHVVKYLPSPSGLGIAFVVPGANGLSMFTGAVIAEYWKKKRRAGAVYPAASGFIAGESLMGIIIAMLITFGVLTK